MNVNDKEFIGRMAQTAPIPLVPSLQGGAVQCNILEVQMMGNCASFFIFFFLYSVCIFTQSTGIN